MPGSIPQATAIVLAAGPAPGMRSATPAVLHRIAGRSLVEHAVRAAAGVRPEQVVVVVGDAGDQVAEHVTEIAKALDCQVTTAPGLPTGLTGTVLVTRGDVPLLGTEALGSLLTEHTANGRGATALAGVAVAADAGTLADAGTADDPAALLDAVRVAGHPVARLAFDDEWQTAAIGDQVRLAEVRAELNRRIVREWMLAGVTVIDPATTWIDADVRLARDVVLEPNTQLRGGTEIGEGATVGPDTTLTDVTVGPGASVVRTHGSGARIGDGASVGPYAYLRPGATLGTKGKIGTFVEVKNSDIGAGSKVPHLSYVGDATIGEHSNIGAASVFVNYDGVNKHRSVVGSHAKMGSDNMYVAPVTIGDGAYSGAGTVLRRDVPPGALAVSGGPQRNLDDWVLRNRPGTAAAEAAQRALDAVTETGDTEEAGR
jgi:bifunctional UDP-N-acetylglucosamine pyrophosphorylase/glucosamine-1-phosphate N-acetyltransferase